MKKLFIVFALAVILLVPFSAEASSSPNANRIGCTPYLDTINVGEPVTVSVSGKHIPDNQVSNVTWVVPYSGSPSSGVGLTFTTSFTTTGFFVIHMYYKGEFSGVCAFDVQE